MHCPEWHVPGWLFTVHAVWSGSGVYTQPAAVSQESAVQVLLSLQTIGALMQLPVA
jgi:hypothetical protein